MQDQKTGQLIFDGVEIANESVLFVRPDSSQDSGLFAKPEMGNRKERRAEWAKYRKQQKRRGLA